MPRFGRAIFWAVLFAAGALAAQNAAEDPFERFRPRATEPLRSFDALLESAESIAIVPLRGETNDINFYSLRRRFDDARRNGADLILLDVDSPGGPLGSSIRIANLVAEQRDPPVVSYVSAWAISGGAMAALGSPHVVMNPRAQIGDIQPIMMAPGPDQEIIEAPEKFVSPLRAVLRTLGEQNGHPIPLLLAMVDPDVVVYRLHLADAEPVFVTGPQREELEATPAWDQVERAELIIAREKLLTLTAGQAEDYGIAARIAEDRDAAVALFSAPGATTTLYEPTSAEAVIAFLNAPWLTSILMLVGLGALYMAVRTPGFGVAETIAIVCFAVFFFSKAMIGKSDVLEPALFLVGLTLILIEVFVVPGFGVIGVTGIVMVLLSLVLALQEFAIPEYTFQWEQAFLNFTMVLGSVLGSILLFMLVARALPGTPMLKRLVHTQSLKDAEGYSVESRDQRSLIGVKGVAVTTLRPAGQVEIDGKLLQAVTEGEMIDQNEVVRVVDVSGNRIVVGRA